jgi:hypothetical protein
MLKCDETSLGVLSQELDEPIRSKLPKNHNYTSYIAASYVKYVAVGCRFIFYRLAP